VPLSDGMNRSDLPSHRQYPMRSTRAGNGPCWSTSNNVPTGQPGRQTARPGDSRTRSRDRARMDRMVNRCERSLNVVNVTSRRRKHWAGAKGNGGGTGAVASPVVGQRKAPTLPANRADLTGQVAREERGKPAASPRPPGRRAARRAVGAAGTGRWKKRKPPGNRADRAGDRRRRYPPRKGADFHPVWQHENA